MNILFQKGFFIQKKLQIKREKGKKNQFLLALAQYEPQGSEKEYLPRSERAFYMKAKSG